MKKMKKWITKKSKKKEHHNKVKKAKIIFSLFIGGLICCLCLFRIEILKLLDC